MAEGGLFLDGSDSSLSRLLQCSICLGQMRQPKSLPCLHSFCVECLSTHIITDLSASGETTFPCPVCRRITSPVNPFERKENWAQHFPTNIHIKKLIDLQAVSGTQQPLCGPCQTTQKITKVAEVWCSTTKTFFCKPCKEHYHDVIHKECDDVALNEESIHMACKQPLPMTCQTHNEKMDCYCEDHKFIGCNKCIITEHRRCDEVTTTKEYFEKQKSNSKLKDMDKTLEEAANGMGLMVNSFDDQVKAMQERQQVELNSIITLRNRINAHLDKKQEEITLQMNSKYKTETGKVDLSRQRCNRLKNAMLNTKEALKLAVVREDDVDTIQLFIRSQTETGASRDLIGQFCDSLTSVNIKHEIGHDLRTLNETSFLTLGKINVEMKRQSMPNGIKLVKTLSNCRAKKVRSITLDTLPGQDGNSVQNSSRKGRKVRTEMDLFKLKPRNPAEFSEQRIALLSKLLIVSFSGQTYICLFTADGQYLDQLKTRGNPSDLCIVDINTVAVSVGDHTIQVVKVQDNKLTQLYVIGTQPRIGCYGITFVNGKFMVSTRKDIYMVTREGEALKVHTLEKDCSHIVYDPLYEQAFVSISEHQRASMSEAEMDDAWIQRPQSCSVFEQDRYAEYDTYEMGAESYRAGNALCVANAYSKATLSQTAPVVVSLMEQAVNLPCKPGSHKCPPARQTKIQQKTILKVGVVKRATGIDVDREGNVYVCGQETNNVVQISADGAKVRELLTSSDGIYSPMAISVCGDKFVVTNQSPQQMKKINVYQLY